MAVKKASSAHILFNKIVWCHCSNNSLCDTLASNKNWARAILPEFSPPFCFLYSSIPHSNQHHYSWRECLISIEMLEIFLKFLFNSISLEWLKEGKLWSVLQFKYLNEKIKFDTKNWQRMLYFVGKSYLIKLLSQVASVGFVDAEYFFGKHIFL